MIDSVVGLKFLRIKLKQIMNDTDFNIKVSFIKKIL